MAIINILGGLASIVSLVRLNKKYHIAPRMGIYVFLSIASMVLLVFTQIYSLVAPGNAWLKVAALFWWGKTLFFAWAQRFNSIKK